METRENIIELEETKRELRCERFKSRAAAVLIVVQLIVMAMMLHSMEGWAEEFAHLQQRYEELATEIAGGDLYE